MSDEDERPKKRGRDELAVFRGHRLTPTDPWFEPQRAQIAKGPSRIICFWTHGRIRVSPIKIEAGLVDRSQSF